MSDAHVTGGDMTAPTLILPDVHHVTGGPENVHVNACQADTSHPSVRAVIDAARQMFASPRIWWWPVESEWGRSDDVRAAPLPVRVPPPDLVSLTEPCDPVDRSLYFGEDRPCPDCHQGQRIVQLVQTCAHQAHPKQDLPCGYCGTLRKLGDGSVSVAQVTITLLPVYSSQRDEDARNVTRGEASRRSFATTNGNVCNWDASRSTWTIRYGVFPFTVEPGKTWVVRAEEVTT